MADPARFAIVRELVKHGEKMNCSETVERAFGVKKGDKKKKALPKSTTSLHFRILREAGLIRSERVGVECDNSLRTAELEKRFPGLVRAILRAYAQEQGGQ
ncbi:MAG TPA: helix-turn-helix domain-containing protein [Candidatus Methylacidiphilales bacterium]